MNREEVVLLSNDLIKIRAIMEEHNAIAREALRNKDKEKGLPSAEALVKEVCGARE